MWPRHEILPLNHQKRFVQSRRPCTVKKDTKLSDIFLNPAHIQAIHILQHGLALSQRWDHTCLWVTLQALWPVIFLPKFHSQQLRIRAAHGMMCVQIPVITDARWWDYRNHNVIVDMTIQIHIISKQNTFNMHLSLSGNKSTGHMYPRMQNTNMTFGGDILFL